MQQKRFEELPEFKAIIKNHTSPTVESIQPLAKSLNIINPSDFWDLFDYARKRWAETKSCESMADWL